MKRDISIGLALFALLLIAPLFGGPYELRLMTIALMYTVLAISWNFIGGMAGYPSFVARRSSALAPTPAQSSRSLAPRWAWRGAPQASSPWCSPAFWAGCCYACAATTSRLRVLLWLKSDECSSTRDEPYGGRHGAKPTDPANFSVQAQATFFFHAMLGLAVITFAVSMAVSYSRLGFGLRCIEQNESQRTFLVSIRHCIKWLRSCYPPCCRYRRRDLCLMGLLHRTSGCFRHYVFDKIHRDGFARWNRLGLWSDHRGGAISVT